nr:ParA family protein [Gammaproteobacteria bacterium]
AGAGRVISVVNMKGGVGKSTTSLMLAEHDAAVGGKRVLVVDLDAQANVSACLVGEQRWAALSSARRTALEYFQPLMGRSGGRSLPPLGPFLEPNASDVIGAEQVTLLASSPLLGPFERDLIAELVQRHRAVWKVQERVAKRMRDALDQAREEFDLIVIDCPPGISLLAEAAIRLSDALIMPTIPDFMSRFGIGIFHTTARRWLGASLEHRSRTGGKILVLPTKYQDELALHRSELAALKANPRFDVLDVAIPQHAQIARAAMYATTRRDIQSKYGECLGVVRRLSDEVERRLGALEAAA